MPCLNPSICKQRGSVYKSPPNFVLQRENGGFHMLVGVFVRQQCLFANLMSPPSTRSPFQAFLVKSSSLEGFTLTEDEAESVESVVMQLLQKDDFKDLTNTGQDGNYHTTTADHSKARDKALQQQVVHQEK